MLCKSAIACKHTGGSNAVSGGGSADVLTKMAIFRGLNGISPDASLLIMLRARPCIGSLTTDPSDANGTVGD